MPLKADSWQPVRSHWYDKKRLLVMVKGARASLEHTPRAVTFTSSWESQPAPSMIHVQLWAKLSTLSSSFTGQLWQRLSERNPPHAHCTRTAQQTVGRVICQVLSERGFTGECPTSRNAVREEGESSARKGPHAGRGRHSASEHPSQVGRNPEKGCLCRSMGMGPEVPECSPRGHDQDSTQPTRDLMPTNQWEKLFQNMREDQHPHPRNHLNTAWEWWATCNSSCLEKNCLTRRFTLLSYEFN